MMKLEFEWDNAKAQANLVTHGVSFDLAKTVFNDPFAIERLDDREDYGEERFVIIGRAEGNTLLFVPMRNVTTVSALFQPEGRHNMSKTTTSGKTLKSMTPQAVEAAARADRDAQPLTPADLKRMKRTPQAKIIRRALALTQEEFSVRYHIPLGTLRDWEQGRAEPDQPTQAYLKVIAREPERVERVLNSMPY
jgi:putative transcriptional regulator